MTTLDSVPTLLAQLRGRSKVQQAVAARELSKLSGSVEGSGAIAAARGIAALAVAVRSSDSAAVQQHALAALSNLAASGPEQGAAIAATGVVHTLVQLMRHPGSVGEAAADAVWGLTISDQGASVASAGGIPALVWVLGRGTQRAQLWAAHAVRNMARENSEEFGLALVAAGALPPCVAMLTGGSAEGQEAAFNAIINLMVEEQGAIAAVAARAVPAMAAHLQGGPAKLQALTAWAIQNLLAWVPAARQLWLEQPGALNSLIGLLSSGSSITSGNNNSHDFADRMQNAAGALYNMACGGSQVCGAIVAAEGIPPLVQLLLSSQDDETVRLAVQALSRLLVHVPCRAALLEAGALPAVQQVQQHARQPGTRETATNLLQMLTAPEELEAEGQAAFAAIAGPTEQTVAQCATSAAAATPGAAAAAGAVPAPAAATAAQAAPPPQPARRPRASVPPPAAAPPTA